MTFMRKFDTIIQQSNKKISKITSDNGLTLYNYDQNYKLTNYKNILSGEFSFLDYWFDIDENDNIYGLVHDKKDYLIYYSIRDNFIVKTKLLKYNSNTDFLKFVYIKKIDKCINIFYYCLDKSNPTNTRLLHRYNKNNKWKTFIIDSFSYNVLTNYVVTYDKNFNPTIFYFKLHEGFEELFTSTFNSDSSSWSNPIQLTNSQKPKIYLSVIYDSEEKYHIVFSENNFNNYYCIYIHGYIKNNNFYIIYNWLLENTVACTFPNILQSNDVIYAQWIEYHNLFIKYSKDYGRTWTNAMFAKDSSTLPFSCCNYHSNLKNQDILNYFVLYLVENSTKILGI